MSGHLSFRLWSALGVVALVACGEDTPTQPSSAAEPGRTAPLPATISNSWKPIAPMPGIFGLETAVGVVPSSSGPSIAYVFGGTTSQGGSGALTRAYNVAANTWSTKTSEVQAFNLNGVGNIGGKLYFSGGYTEHGSPFATASTWEYDPATDKLTQKADIPLHTADGVTGVIGDKLYVLPGYCYAIGLVSPGYCDEQENNRRLFRYNPATDTWVVKRWAPHYHRGAAGGVINQKFYVVGGLDANLNPTRNLDVYDPVTNTWKTLAPLPVAMGRPSGTTLRGQLFVTGNSKIYAYNPTTNTWSTKTAPPAGGSAAQVFLNGTSRMLLVSGATQDEPDHSLLYTP